MMHMQKIRIFWRDPDATDSSSDEDGQKPMKEKTITIEMPVPGQEYSSHNTEEATGAAYQAKRSQYRAEMLAMKAQPSVSEHVAFSNSRCKKRRKDKRVGVFMEIHHEPLDESLLTPTPRDISEDATLDWKCELPDIDSVSLADEFPHDDLTRPEDMFPIGLADISHLHPPFKDPEFDWDAELDWSWFDFASLEHELWLL
ncbi:hypothetical protein BS78_02G147600 [Paspalum vaginatum]|nr:hypothetical protein BS78_02G147600 [Paspalum vaginatum]